MTVQPIEQDLRVTYRRMSDAMERSRLARDARLARRDPEFEPYASRDTSELVNVVILRLTEPCCTDERIAS